MVKLPMIPTVLNVWNPKKLATNFNLTPIIAVAYYIQISHSLYYLSNINFFASEKLVAEPAEAPLCNL